MTNSVDNWAWWASDNGEHYRIGPCATREQAIAEAVRDELGYREVDGKAQLSFEVAECENAPLRLSDWLASDGALLEQAEERIYDSDRIVGDFDDPPIFDGITPEQETELGSAIKAVVDAWQDRHGFVWAVSTFSAIRNRAQIVRPLRASMMEDDRDE